MPFEEFQKVLEIGSGTGFFPYLMDKRVEAGIATEVGCHFSRIRRGMLYVGVDRHMRSIEHAVEQLRGMESDGAEIIEEGGRLHAIQCDARQLPLTGTYDAIILSDVLSCPGEVYDVGSIQGDRWKMTGVSEEDKATLLDIAWSLLRPNGALIVATYQTPIHAMRAVHEELLGKTKKWNFELQIGELECLDGGDYGASVGWCEQVFRKAVPGTRPVLTIMKSLDESQKIYLELQRHTLEAMLRGEILEAIP